MPGTGEDFAIESPSPTQRALIGLLARGFKSEDELGSSLAEHKLDAVETGDCLDQLLDLGLVEKRPGTTLLSPAELERYDRQLIYWADLAEPNESAEQLQRRLAEASVVVVGCGGLGSWAASALACAGVGKLILIDDDRVEASNLNRQLLYTEGDIDRLKVEAAATALCQNNSGVEVVPLRRRVRGPEDLAPALERADFLISTADWPPYRLPRWVNRACLNAKVAYISAAQLLPIVRVGPMVIPGRSACFACLERQTRRSHPLYDELAARPPRPPKAATLGAASGVAGSLLAMEAIHHLTRATEPTTVDTAVVLNLQTLEISREHVEPDSQCPECSVSRQPSAPSEHVLA